MNIINDKKFELNVKKSYVINYAWNSIFFISKIISKKMNMFLKIKYSVIWLWWKLKNNKNY